MLFLRRYLRKFVKDKIAIKVQFGKYSFVAFVLFVKQTVLKVITVSPLRKVFICEIKLTKKKLETLKKDFFNR